MKTIKLGLVQMRCEKGAIEENLTSTHAYLEAGMRQSVDIMCFPEMNITGYANLYSYPEIVLHLDGPEVACFVNMTKDRSQCDFAKILHFIECFMTF
jgi:(R)-amidase